MVLEINSQETLCCTFNASEIKKYFSKEARDFLHDRRNLEKLSNILICKANETTGTGGKTEEVTVILYHIAKEQYMMVIERRAALDVLKRELFKAMIHSVWCRQFSFQA